MTTTMNMNGERANKVTITMVEDHYEARFFRTHKQLTTIDSRDTAFVANTSLNKSAQRELFRLWICENSNTYGIVWQPADMRTEENKLPNKYPTEAILLDTASQLIRNDILEWVAKNERIALVELVGEFVIPVTEHKGKIVDSKYGNGNWAYATVSVTATIKDLTDNQDYYISMDCSLVSGQLKKPVKIGENGYTMTGFYQDLAKDLPSIIEKKVDDAKKSTKDETPKTAEVPAEKSTKEKTPKASVTKEPKTASKKSSKASKPADAQ